MCRWFAYISAHEECLIDDMLVCKLADPMTAPAHALVKQVNEHYLPDIVPKLPTAPAAPGAPNEGNDEEEVSADFYNNYLNNDGFGMSWYTPTFSIFSPAPPVREGTKAPRLHPSLYKTIQPPINDLNFRSLAINSSTTVLLAHIRATSGAGVVNNNNHPFTFGTHAIMHNGCISSFPQVKRRVIELISPEAYNHIQGSTDSEHFAALFMTNLCPSKSPFTQNPDTKPTAEPEIPASWETFHTAQEMKDALCQTIKSIIDIQKEVLGDKALSNFFNFAITDGHTLIASRFRNHPTMDPTSLYYSTSAGATLNRRYPDHPRGPRGPWGGRNGRGYNPNADRETAKYGNHLIIASEPCTYKPEEWTQVQKNHLILSEGGNVLSIEPVEFPEFSESKSQA